MKHAAAKFCASAPNCVDISTPGWTPTPGNVAKLKTEVERLVKEGVSSFVFNLHTNTALRYTQFDGSTSLPYKSQGRYHLEGDVVTSPMDLFKKSVDSVIPMYVATGTTNCVILPPQPRFLFKKCCNDATHCTNYDEPNFSGKLLNGYINFRNTLIRHLVASGLRNFKVLDSCCTTDCISTATTPERLEALRKVTAHDGIHVTAKGHENLVARALKCIHAMSISTNTGMGKQPATRPGFWRGFKSPRGTMHTHMHRAWDNQRGRPWRGSLMRAMAPHRGYHPYRRN
jgi:hypothetical protein